jgi:hypothetical protein
MPTSQDDLDKKVTELEKLRTKIAETRDERLRREQDVVNDITSVQLDAEIETARLELQREQELGKASNIKARVAPTIDDAKAAMERASVQMEAESAPSPKKVTAGEKG